MTTRSDTTDTTTAILTVDHLDQLVSLLQDDSRTVLGPVIKSDAVVFDEITTIDDLPRGYEDEQQPGHYRLRRTDADHRFRYVQGPQSLKKHFFPPRRTLWNLQKDNGGLSVKPFPVDKRKVAIIGIRPCDLAAVLVQDRVFLEGPFEDSEYHARRADTIIVAVNCTNPGGTCFCTSMGTGPAATDGFDIALTELIRDGQPYYHAEATTDSGRQLLERLDADPAGDDDTTAAKEALADAAQRMGRELETDGLKELLQQNPEHPHWRQVAKRCLSCGNCTLVCPTCFCSAVEDTASLDGFSATRSRRWDSCYSLAYSYIHGGSVRPSGLARYRHWITHKLANWHDQFGTSGCVGCGRCITWCPVGIDITEEARALRQSQPAAQSQV